MSNSLNIGGWHDYEWKSSASIVPASKTGVVGLGFILNPDTTYPSGVVTITGFTPEFTVIDLSEPGTDPVNGFGTKNTAYVGGIQSVDKSFSGTAITVPVPFDLATGGTDIGFVESAVITIAGVWFDGLTGRDSILEDLRTTKSWVDERYRQFPFVFLMSNRAYFVFITGYSSNFVGGQGNILSFRLGLSICSGKNIPGLS